MQRAFEMAAQRSQIVFGAAPAGDIICKASRTSKALQRLYKTEDFDFALKAG